jgi:hypothetical protein
MENGWLRCRRRAPTVVTDAGEAACAGPGCAHADPVHRDGSGHANDQVLLFPSVGGGLFSSGGGSLSREPITHTRWGSRKSIKSTSAL